MGNGGKGSNEEVREIAPLSIRATFKPGSIDAEKRTAEVVFSTGARVKRGGFWEEPFLEELSLDPAHVRLDRLASGRAPLLNSHDSYDLRGVIGVVEKASVDGKQGVATVRFAKATDDPEADQIFRKVQDGIIQNISVGYRVHKFERVQQGESEKTALPVFRAVDWEPFEVSAVSMPADAGAHFRSAGGKEAQTAPCIFVNTRSEENKMDAKNPIATAVVEPAAIEEAKRGAAAEATKAERERVTGIRQAVRVAKLGDDLAEKLIGEGVKLDAAREAVITRLAENDAKTKTDPHHRMEAGEDSREKFVRGAGAWLIQRAGVQGYIDGGKKKAPDHPAFADVANDPGEFRGMTLLDLAKESLDRAGVKHRGLDKQALVGLALTHRDGGFNTTSDFAVLLETTMNKTLLGAYMTTPDTWSRWCGVRTANDFRTQSGYRLGSFGTLDSLNEAGEFKNKSIPDGEKVTFSVGTKGNIIGLSRKAIINDDMGAFSELAARFGRAAKLSIEVDVYNLLGQNSGLGPTQSDAQPFFHANRANVNATGSAYSAAGVDADRVVLKVQKDPAGNELLDLPPAIALVPAALGGVAKVVNNSQYDPDTLANKSQMKPNLAAGLFRDIIDTGRLTGTRRYLFIEPAISPAFIVAFLEGRQDPFLDSQEGWRVDGVEWKVRLDYGVKEYDFRAAVTNAGA